MKSNERAMIEKGMLESIESEIRLVDYLCETYKLSLKIHTYIPTLTRQKQAIKAQDYLLEQESLGDNIIAYTAYFADGTNRVCRCQKVVSQKQIV